MRSRRRILIAAGAGLTLNLAGLGRLLAADAVRRGVRRVSGDVRINGRPATRGMGVKSGDDVVT